jgi:RHS repeat-associated protein
LGNITRFDYDTSGNLIAIIDPLKNRTTLAYNASGQPTSTTDPLGNITTWAYDNTGNLTSITDPLGNTSQRSYDLVSRLTARSDPRGKIAKHVYDALNRLTSIIDPTGGVTRFLYDSNSNLLEFTDARGNTVAHSYDSMDRLVTRTDPLGAVETLQYDGLGNVRRHTDRKGQVAVFDYDALNRRTAGSYADGTTTSYVYDGVGRMIRATDSPDGSIANQYDGLDRLVAQTTNLGSLRYQHDALGRRTSIDTPGQIPITYSYDAASRLTQIVQGTEMVGLTYDAAGRRTRLVLPNGISTEYQYDTASRLAALIYRNALGVLGDLTYQYDRASNRTGVGGSFARTLLPGPVSSANYDTANRQLQFGNKQMSFDANGNLSSATDSIGTTMFSWDARNQLVGRSGAGTSAGFVYDVFGRRSEARVNNRTVQYQYDGLNPFKETSGAGVSANFLTGPGIDEYFIRTDIPSGSRNYFLADVLGSSVALTDEFAVVQTEYTYEPFGKTAVTGGLNSNPFQYTGRELDGTGLHYYRTRYYDSETQRFIGEDPLGIAAGDPNLFVYTKNNPTNFRDPTGQFVPQAVVAGALCAAGAVAGSYTYQQLAGRKTSFAGFLGSAAAGCVGGLGLGWAIGIALEAAIPSIMVGGGQVTVWGGFGSVGPQLATAKAAEIGATTIYQTFTGSTLSLLDSAGVGALTASYWPTLSANFVSGAGSATVLVGRGLSGGSVLLKELRVLLQNQAVLNHIFYP